MKNFLASCACEGVRPKNVGPSRQISRPVLLGRMLAQRDVPRFLVAPAGFGKTSLVLEYAKSIFDFRETFWVNCKSPCFMRDLDAGIISSTFLRNGCSNPLVVFEDVPLLDDLRAQAFSREIDNLIEHRWEVIATCAPSADVYDDFLHSRVVLRATDLLVSDVELEEANMAAAIADTWAHDRVAAFVWGGPDDVEAMVKGLREESIADEVSLALFSMLVLQEGGLDEVVQFGRGFKRDLREHIALNYPFCGIDLVEERFQTADISVAQVLAALSSHVEACFDRATSVGKDGMVYRLATALLARGRGRRACDFMRLGCARKRRLAWLEEHQARFFEIGDLDAVEELFRSMGPKPMGLSAATLLGCTVRTMLLGDEDVARAFSQRVLDATDSVPDQRFLAAVVQSWCGDGPLSGRAGETLSLAWEYFDREQPTSLSRLLAQVASASPVMGELRCDYGEVARRANVCELVSLAWMLARCARRYGQEGAASVQGQAFDVLVQCAKAALATEQQRSAQPRLPEAMLVDSLGGCGEAPQLAADRQSACEALIVAQEAARSSWRRYVRENRIVSSSRPARRTSTLAQEMVPELYVRLFGGMEISIGGYMVDPRILRKQQEKTLLAVLVLHRGREIARDTLLSIMWPESTHDRALNLYYSLWSSLSRGLGVADGKGECPYLVRHQRACMVDSRYVHSDVEQFESLCKMLMFDPIDKQGWLSALGRLQDEFSCDLLPSEDTNEFIVGARERMKSVFVDATIAASQRLMEAQEAKMSLWFARAARDMDSRREDVNYNLALAQALDGQRTEAMDTIASWRSYLSNELGIDLPDRMMRLYERLLSSEDAGFGIGFDFA